MSGLPGLHACSQTHQLSSASQEAHSLREGVGLGIFSSPWRSVHLQGPEKNSQDETHSLVKVKVKPELHFCGQTDDGISWRPGIIIGSAQNCHLKSRLWGGCTTKRHSKSTEVFLQAALIFPLPLRACVSRKARWAGWTWQQLRSL